MTELSTRLAEGGQALVGVAYRGIILSVAAMALRNALVLGLLDHRTLLVSASSLGLMFVASGILAFVIRPADSTTSEAKPLALKSPFSLVSALKFGAIFLVLQVFGSVGQALFGHFGFYAVSFLGGLVSSASAVAAAATLAAHHQISPTVAGVGAVVASLASASVNVLLVGRFSRSTILNRRVSVATAIVLAVGLAGAILTARFA